MSYRMVVGWEEHLNGPIVELLHRVAADVESDAQDNAPVRTGFLRDSIHAEVDEASHTIDVVADAAYAGYVELGTSTRQAQPYLRPALYKERRY